MTGPSLRRELSVGLTSGGDDNGAREGQEIVSNNDLIKTVVEGNLLQHKQSVASWSFGFA